MSIFGWILFGFVVGILARAIMPGKDPLGLLGTTILGILGAVLAGWLGQVIGWYRAGQPAGFIAATLGALVVLSIYYGVTGRKQVLVSKLKRGEREKNKDHRHAA